MIAGFRSLDFMVNQTYYNANLWKTNAPPEAIYDIFKAFKQEKSANEYMKNLSETSVAHKILSREIKYKPNFNVD